MPIDFRTYTDPGVYIESIAPPVVFSASIEPTILAIVGDAPTARDVTESVTLLTGAWGDLSTLGGDPSTVEVFDRLLGTQYVSAAIGTLVALISDVATTWSINLFDANWIEPAANFTAQIEDEQVTIDVAASGPAVAGVYPVSIVGGTRGLGSTDPAQHAAGQVMNNAEAYSTTASLEVASLEVPISATSTSFTTTEGNGVQVISTAGAIGYGAGDSFKLTYGGQETVAFVHGTNAAASDIATGLINLSTIAAAGVTVTGTTNTGPWTISFFNPNTDVTPLTVTSPVGYTGAFTVTKRGVVANSYLDIEGERMRVSAVAGSSPQTVTVVRGVSGTGTSQKTHGATVRLYENTGADYLLKVGIGVDATLGTSDDTTSLQILDTLRISNGTAVVADFSATDDTQFAAALFDDLSTVRDKYGTPFDDTGQINSDLSLAAQLAFANGATQLVLVAANPGDVNPIQDAIERLQFEQSINSIAILSGDATDITYVKGHVQQMEAQGLLRRAFVSLDGLASPAPTPANFITKAQSLVDERISLVGPGQFKVNNGTDTPLVVPGYFAAAAVAGLQAGLTPQEPLTRKQVFGFVGINDQATQANVFAMQSKGVLVVFEDRLGRLIIKHGLTTDMSSVYTREISVITARDRLRDFIQETLDSGQIVGSPMTANTPDLVVSAVTSALEESVRQGLIFDYNDVLFRVPTDVLTLIEVRFAYKPSLPLNYVHVQFAIDTTLGTVEFQSIDQNTSQ